jgi:hypothetical protein
MTSSQSLSAPPTFNGISIILPCLNEADSIVQVIEAARRGLAKLGLPNSEIIVVDNGSRDNSADLARAAGARVLVQPHKGYGSALRLGFAKAAYPVMVMGDADLSYDFAAVDELVKPILRGEADFVVGNRMKSIKPGAMPLLHRYLGNPSLSFLLRVMFSGAVNDAHCGLRAITREAYDRLRCVTTGMEFASEMIVRAIRCRLRIAEQDIVYHPRVGESKLRSFRDGWRHLRFMILHSPTLLLLIPGLLCWVLGLAFALPLAFGPLDISARSWDIHSMLLAGVLNIVSIQVITIGLLAKAYAHLSGLHRDPVIAWLYRWLTFEKATAISAAVFLVGVLLVGYVVAHWGVGGFGALNKPRLLFLAIICLVNGVQIGAASFLFSIMALPRHFDRLPDEVADTGVPDI